MTQQGRPRVLMALGAYYPEMSGGGLQARELIRRLRDRVDFTVVTTSSTTDESTEIDGVPVHRIRIDPASAVSRAGGLLRFARLMPALGRAAGVVHLQSVSQKNLLLTLAARLFGAPLLLTLHTGGHDDAERMREEDPWSFRAMQRADAITAVSPALLESAKRAGLHATLQWIPNGVDVERFRPPADGERQEIRRALGLPVDKTLILFVGFFSRDKGAHRLFDAWQRLSAPLRERSTIVFLGQTEPPHPEIDPSLATEIRERAAYAEAAPIFVERSFEAERYYQAADVFALPSIREGFPVALLEAMAVGLPVVSSHLTGSTDVVITDRANGMLVPPGDIDALAGGLRHLLCNPGTAALLGAAARSTIVESFSLDGAAQAYLNLYSALSTRGSAS